jgi:phage-related protein
MINTVVNVVIPAISKFMESVGGKEGLTNAFKTYIDLVKSIFLPVLQGFKFAFDQIKKSVMDNAEEFAALFKFLRDFVAPFMGGVFKLAIQGIGIALGVVIDVVAALIRGFQTLFGIINSVVGSIQTMINLVKNNAVVEGISGVISSAFGGFRANGGSVQAGKSYVVGERGAEMFVPSSNGSIVPNSGMGGSTINITVNGAIDAEGTARTIVDVLNRSNARGTLGANRLAFV